MVNSVSGVITILTMILSCVKMVISIISSPVLSASLSDSEREVGESIERGQRPQSLCVFCTVVILFKLFLDCYSIRACLKIEENDGFFTQNG